MSELPNQQSRSISGGISNSCKELYNTGVITDNQYLKCLSEIDGLDHQKKIALTETNVFGESRDMKERKYREFLQTLKEFIEKLTQKLRHNSFSTLSPNDRRHYVNVAIMLNTVMNNVLDWIQDTNVKRYKTKEKSQYKQLLTFYNKMDENRNELTKVQGHFQTLDKINNSESIKLEKHSNYYKTIKNIMIVFIILNCITIIIIFLLYFI